MTGIDELGGIAVIGLAGRFPGARDAAAYWQNLRGGVESVTFFDLAELEGRVAPELLRDPGYVPACAVLADPDRFDAPFFGYSGRDAALLDPQQRIFLESAWHALEDAGYDPGQTGGTTGVYAGAALSAYLIGHLLPGRGIAPSSDSLELLIANDKDYVASRTSYKLGLSGPAICVQTACSTSLVAVHTAVQALLGYECDVALAGGVTLRLPQDRGYLYQEGLIFSPDGHCRPFDAAARGTIAGSGAGVVVLKRLEDAMADRDQVLAVIRGSAVNNDGAAKVGFTAPSVEGQAEVIATALGIAQLRPEDIGAIETHGTGTQLGDPIEIRALSRVFGPVADRPASCAIGSVKSNIGHLDCAAGVASLIKAVLQLRHGELVPSLNYTEPNPQIDFGATPFYVNTELRAWKADGEPRRIGVSSFGFGGTNAHVILEEAPPRQPVPAGRPLQLLPVSAATPAALDEACVRLGTALAAADAPGLADAAYTLQAGRRPLSHRRIVIAETAPDAARSLAEPRAHGRAGRARRRPAQDRLAVPRPGQPVRRHEPGPLPRPGRVPGPGGRLRRALRPAARPGPAHDHVHRPARPGSSRPPSPSPRCSPPSTPWPGSCKPGAWSPTPCSVTASASSPPPAWRGCCPWTTPWPWSPRGAGSCRPSRPAPWCR